MRIRKLIPLICILLAVSLCLCCCAQNPDIPSPDEEKSDAPPPLKAPPQVKPEQHNIRITFCGFITSIDCTSDTPSFDINVTWLSDNPAYLYNIPVYGNALSFSISNEISLSEFSVGDAVEVKASYEQIGDTPALERFEENYNVDSITLVHSTEDLNKLKELGERHEITIIGKSVDVVYSMIADETAYVHAEIVQVSENPYFSPEDHIFIEIDYDTVFKPSEHFLIKATFDRYSMEGFELDNRFYQPIIPNEYEFGPEGSFISET